MTKNKFESFDDIITSYLFQRGSDYTSEKGSKYWSASSLGKCMRYQALNRACIVMPGASPNINWKNNAEDGHLMHAWRQLAVSRMEALVDSEGEIIDDDLNYRGHYDVIAMLYNKAADREFMSVCDIKTMNNRAFRAMARINNVDPCHKRQVVSYWYFARKHLYPDLEDSRIYYVNRNTGERKEFVIQHPELLAPSIIDELNGLNEAWDSGLLPKRQTDTFCNLCQYASLCKQLKNSKNTKINDAIQRSLSKETE